MADAPDLHARSAFQDLLRPIGATHSVMVSERTDIRIAMLVARRDRTLALFERAREALGVDLPRGPKRSALGDIAFLGLGPGKWFAISSAAPPLTERLRDALGDAAVITDQSDGYAVLRVSGEKAIAAFEKGFSVDLHRRAFGPDDVASTTCAHVPVIIWRIDDAPIYEIAMFRSYVASFGHWLMESAAEFGFGVE